ncbi:MAG: outer membrane beta-barrel protein [Alphaproteobacteria bacterium]|nr:outer membrane beta-barrel protein [Alphaproteobacteria bacterium]
MKKLAISTLAVLIACPAFAGYQNEGSSWQIWGFDPYIGLRGGVAYNNTNYNFLGNKASLTDATLQGRVALGLEMCDNYRTEIEWSMFSKAKDTARFNDYDVDVKTSLQTLLMNAYMEFDTHSMIRPFIGLGAGAGFASIDRSGFGIMPHTSDKAGFAANGVMGMTFDWQQFAVDVAARYTYVDVQSGLHNFGADVGIRFMF